MTTTATALSMTVESLISAATLGIGYITGAAKAAATLTYVTVYTLMTKFFIDIELHEAESRTRSETFYPTSNEIQKPISLNEKMIYDRVLGDSMAAALIGHPGGYYTTVSGGEPGNQYNGQLLVSPPSPARSIDTFGGMLELLWENLWDMGESDPDAFYALDFDDMNLDYFLLASELPSYNYRSNYAFPNTDGDFNDYNAYAKNTLGYLERKVKIVSDNEFNAIRATCVDGRPQYEFINREDYQKILPQSGLYHPIVLSEERYNQLNPRLGHLIIFKRVKTSFPIIRGLVPHSYAYLLFRRKGIRKEKAEFTRYVDEFNKLFNDQYSIYGFAADNPFYFDGRLNAHKIGDILMDYGFIDKNELTGDLYRFIQPFGASEKSLTMFSYKTEDYKYSIPAEATYINLKLSLEIAILDFADRNAEITEETAEKAIDEVNSLMDNFIQLIVDAKEARKIFDGYNRKHAKVDLLMRIQFSHPALRRISSIKEFSELLFGDECYLQKNFLRWDYLENRPEHRKLHGITYNIKQWTTESFDNSITESELEDVKNKVENVIYNWIFSNPSQYAQSYVTETPRRFGKIQSKSFLSLEYELMQALTHAVSAYNEKVFIGFGEVLDELGILTRNMETLLSHGEQSATVSHLLKAKSTIVSYIVDGFMTEQKLSFYDKALGKIDEYLATRHLRLFEEKLVSRQGYDKKLWSDDKIMAYHVITLLCRDLGFDPLTFQPLNPQIFDADPGTGLFARHHLDILRKYSVYMQDLLLTDNSKHREYDSNIPLSDQKILVQIIQDLIQIDGSGPNSEITANDVVKAFLDNFGDPIKAKYYLENYWQSGDFQQNLDDFNERKEKIKNGEYEEFIRTKYGDAYTRFFNDAMNMLNSLAELSDYEGYKLSRVFSIADIYYLRRVFSI